MHTDCIEVICWVFRVICSGWLEQLSRKRCLILEIIRKLDREFYLQKIGRINRYASIAHPCNKLVYPIFSPNLKLGNSQKFQLSTTETTSRSKQINTVVSLVCAAGELRFMKCLSTWLPRWPKQKFKGDFPDLTREALKACIACAADRERPFMTDPLSAWNYFLMKTCRPSCRTVWAIFSQIRFTFEMWEWKQRSTQ